MESEVRSAGYYKSVSGAGESKVGEVSEREQKGLVASRRYIGRWDQDASLVAYETTGWSNVSESGRKRTRADSETKFDGDHVQDGSRSLFFLDFH